MASYSRATEVAAPLAEVWDFHREPGALESVSPGWLDLAVDEVVGPDGTHDPERLATGTRIEASVHPFGLGGRRGWTSVVERCEASEDRAFFRDLMVDGPFPRWVHTHAFLALEEDTTLVADRVVYRLPLAGPLSVVGNLGLAPMFRHRHRRTRRLLG